MSNVINLKRYRVKQKQAEYYYFMTKCGTNELAKHCGITYSEAKRLILKFIKKRK